MSIASKGDTMAEKSFSAQCLQCDLRSDMKKRVSYVVLSIVICVAVGFTGASYNSLTSVISNLRTDVNTLRTDVKVIGTAVSKCQNRMGVIEIQQENDRGMIRHLDKELKDHVPDRIKREYQFDRKRMD